MNVAVVLMTSLINATWFRVVLVGSQLVLALSVVVLLLIWWVEWRNGRVW